MDDDDREQWIVKDNELVPIYLQGEVEKMGYIHNNWKRRWFILTRDGEFIYFESEAAFKMQQSPKGSGRLMPFISSVKACKDGAQYVAKANCREDRSGPSKIIKGKSNLLEVCDAICESNGKIVRRTFYFSLPTQELQLLFEKRMKEVISHALKTEEGRLTAVLNLCELYQSEGMDVTRASTSAQHMIDAYSSSYDDRVRAIVCYMDGPALDHLAHDGFDVTRYTSRRAELTPLHDAVIHGNMSIISWYCDHHTDLNVKDKHDHTPLFYAMVNGNMDAVSMLLAAGATPIAEVDDIPRPDVKPAVTYPDI